MTAARDDTLYTVDARNGFLGTYTMRSADPIRAATNSGVFDGSRLGGVALADDGVLAVTFVREGKVRLVRPDGAELASFGAAGRNAGQLQNPRGVAVSTNRRIYVADRGNRRVAVFSRDGVFLRHIGSEVLETPEAVAVNAGEQLFVLDRTGDGALVQFDEAGSVVNRWSADQLSNGDLSLTTFALGPDNILYVADAKRSRVFVLDRAEGRLVEAFGSSGAGTGQFDRISALAGLDGARVAVADSGNGKIEIYRVGVPAEPVRRAWLASVELAPKQDYPCDQMRRIAADEFLCLLEDEKAVALRNAAGEELMRYSTPDMDEPEAAAADEHHAVVLHGRYMSVFTRDGAHVTTIGGTGRGNGTFRGPVDVSLRGDRIYVADSSLRQIQVFSRDGVFLMDIRNPEYGDRILEQPVGVVADSQGTIYVADGGRADVAVFNAAGEELYRLGGDDGGGGVRFEDVRDIEMDPDGQLYVLAAVRGADARIVVFNGPRAVFAFGAAEGGPAALEDPRRFAVGAWPGTGVTVQDEDRVVDFRYLQVPGRVTGVDMRGDSERVELEWTPVPGRYVTEYRVYDAPASGGAFAPILSSDEPEATLRRSADGARRYRVAAVSGFGREGPRSPVAEDRLGMAIDALRQGNAERAEGLLRAEYAGRPQDPAILEWLGRALLMRGDATAAAGFFERLAAVAEDRAAALRLQIEALVDSGEHAAAQAAIREVIEAGEADAQTYLRCGQVSLELADPIGAVDCIDRIPASAPERGEASFLLARAYVGLGLPDEAAVALERGVGSAGDSASAHARAGQVLLSLERHEAALAHFRKAFEAGSDDRAVRLAYARTALKLEQFDEVNHVAVELAGDPATEAQGRYLRGLVAQSRGEHPRALIELGRATRSKPDFVEAWLALAQTYRAMERDDDARNALEAAWQADRNSFEAALGYGRALRGAERYAASAEPLTRAHELRPSDAGVARELADSLLRAKRLQAARNAAEDALQAAAGDVDARDEARVLLAEVAHGLGRTARAIELVRTVLERRPDDGSLHLRLGRIYLDSNLYERAEEALSRAQTLAPDRAEPHRLLGDVYLERRMFDQAIAAYEQAIAIEASQRNRAALENAFAEKKRSLEFGANRPRIVLRDLNFEPVFAAAYKQYTEESFGSVTVANVGEADYGNLKLTFRVKGYMDFATQHQIEELPAGSRKRISLTAAFNNRILEIDEDTGVQSEVALEYTVGGRSDSISLIRPVTIYGKNAILWGKDRMVGAFVTPRDDSLRDFVRRAINAYRPEPGSLNERLVTAMTWYNTLSAHGMKYVVDPNNPFAQVKDGQVDYVQFPRESLHLKTGDCDDLSVLLAAGLQNLGIETAVVGIPGHLFMMFNTGLPESERSLVSADESLTVVRGGTVWVPIEATLVGEAFTEAWAEGARKYNRHAGTDGLEVVALEEAWREYAPVTLPPADLQAEIPAKASVEPRIERERTLLLAKSIERLTRPYRAMLATNPDNRDARLQIAVLQGRYGLHEQALDGFAEILAENPNDSAAFNNRGNVFLLQGRIEQALETYHQAEALAPNDPGIKVNLALAHYRDGNLERAREKIAEAERIDQAVPEQYPRLVAVLSD